MAVVRSCINVFTNLKKICHGEFHPKFSLRFLSYASKQYSHDHDPAPLFFDNEVQTLLKALTRSDLKKVYKRRRLGDHTLEQPVYTFMTDEQLQQSLTEARQKADVLLQMPPVVQIRRPKQHVLSMDPAIQGFDTSKYVFTDITYGVDDENRLIVTRELDGTLREADWDIRSRMNQLYHPKIGREFRIPQMFKDNYLERLLSHKEYEFILDRSCIQFEPDDPEYQRVSSITYQHIDDNNDYDILRSTRHFGPLCFFLTWFKIIDNILLELIETAHVDDANRLLQLYGKIHNLEFQCSSLESLEIIERYISGISQKRASLELALQAYKELQHEQSELKHGIQVAHGYS